MSDFHFLDHVRQHYFAELERKRDLNSLLTLSVGVSTAAAAGIYALANKTDRLRDTSDSLTLALLVFATAALGRAIFFLVRSHVGHEFAYLGGMAGLVEARANDRAGGATREQTEISTIRTLERRYAESVAFNEVVNDLKSSLLNRANVALVSSLVFLLLGGITASCEHIIAIAAKA
jgi:hypothetical protein